MYEQMKHENTNRRLIITAIALLTIVMILLVGLAAAYFSDKAEHSGTITAGELKLQGSYSYFLNGNTVSSSEISNLKPGDAVTITADITNIGNLSAWIREKLILETIDAELLPYFSIYTGIHTQSELKENDLSSFEIEIDQNGVAVTSNKVINGSLETETTESTEKDYDFLGSTNYTSSITIYFSHEAGNAAQKKSFTLCLTTEALQFRNNSQTEPQESAWSAVFSNR